MATGQIAHSVGGKSIGLGASTKAYQSHAQGLTVVMVAVSPISSSGSRAVEMSVATHSDRVGISYFLKLACHV